MNQLCPSKKDMKIAKNNLGKSINLTETINELKTVERKGHKKSLWKV